MSLQANDTIAAIATAQGRGGIGAIRISGGKEIASIAVSILGKLPPPRFATYSTFKDGSGDLIDTGIALYFPAPHSYTGENVLELQGHGGVAVLQLLLARCLDLGARIAQPGEFTLRAFLNHKIDLAQAESVADLIEANTSEAVKSAMRSLQGEFSNSVHQLTGKLINLRMLIEAMLDFPEEQIEASDMQKHLEILNTVQGQLQSILDTAKRGNLLKDGAYVVIAGRPNVGKSSLLNRMAGQELALVSDIPGTTRDVIRMAIQIRGVPIYLMDTAGLRETLDQVEIMGMERTHQTIHQADLVLLVIDACQGLTEQDKRILDDLPDDIPCILVLNKIDLLSGTQPIFCNVTQLPSIFISAKMGEGLDSLYEEILETVGWRDQEGGVYIARERHLQALLEAQNHLIMAQKVADQLELFAEELSMAQQSLNQITGEFTPDDLLGEIFSNFCIGK